MSDNSDIRNDDSVNEAVQAVEDRVLSWHAGAPVETVRAALEEGLEKAGESKDAQWVSDTAERISNADSAQK
jgi:hypothetical protein